MSIIFGIRVPAGDIVRKDDLLDLASTTTRWAPDGSFVCSSGSIGMGFQPYHTHERSTLESQPVVDDLGNMIALDGRIDNHSELRKLLNLCDPNTPDSRVVLAAFRHWREHCFGKLLGDWAVAIWSATDDSLYLARDHAGSRTLYYEQRHGCIIWATFLEAFFVDRRTKELDRTYAARYLACQPVGDLTPYKGVIAVTPAHYVIFRKERTSHKEHWQSMVKSQLHYSSIEEYEEHFLLLFKEAVQRRSGPGKQILAHLSGGVDSTSIVCVSDHLRRNQGAQPCDLLDTLSYFDDSESNWDERPYFTLVESRRQKSGIHIRTSLFDDTWHSDSPLSEVYLLPGGGPSHLRKEKQFLDQISGKDYRVVLSGFGGDELLGGTPTPLPELADYFIERRLRHLFKKSLEWSVANREPLSSLILETLIYTFRLYFAKAPYPSIITPWISKELKAVLEDSPYSILEKASRLSRKPSALSNGDMWWVLIETLPHKYPKYLYRHEYRYPFLDRDLVGFLFSLPREHLLKPRRRRYMMRRAMQGIVPPEILERKRKANVSRGPEVLWEHAPSIVGDLFNDSLCAAHSLIDVDKLTAACRVRPSKHDPRWWSQFMSTVAFELWLRGMNLTPTNALRIA